VVAHGSCGWFAAERQGQEVLVRDTTNATAPAPGWQQRRSGVQFYFCCCPFMMLLAPFILVARLVQYGMLRLLGRPVVSPWARKS